MVNASQTVGGARRGPYRLRRRATRMDETRQRITQAAGLKECPVKGTGRNGAFVLASVWLYQICFLADYRARYRTD